MWLRIAKDWLHCTVSEAIERLSSVEFAEICAYYRIEPWGFDVENFRFGMICATAVNVTPRPKGSKPMGPEEFYPLRKERKRISPRLEAELKRRKSQRA